MAKLVEPLGADIIGVNKKGKPVDGCSKIITIDKLDLYYQKQIFYTLHCQKLQKLLI